MKTIRLQHPHSYKKDTIPDTVLALGFFDGVHLGHQQVINTAKDIANSKGFQSAVMTFDPHPSVVLSRNQKRVEYITPLNVKIDLIASLGVDVLYIVEFTEEFANLLPQEFVDEFIINLNVKHVVAGFDFSYGKLGKGTMETMPFHSRNQFTQTTIDKLTSGNEKISSTRIRQTIKNGEIDKLPALLGRYYFVTGKVIDGDKRGRTIGFPTANIQLSPDYLSPPLGVYAVTIKVKDNWYIGVCNIGVKPTFKQENTIPTIEVHIINYNETIYGEFVTVEWYKRIRSEKKFSGVSELIEQIAKDKDETINYFEKINERTCFLL